MVSVRLHDLYYILTALTPLDELGPLWVYLNPTDSYWFSLGRAVTITEGISYPNILLGLQKKDRRKRNVTTKRNEITGTLNGQMIKKLGLSD